MLEVEDFGIGIAREHLPQVFDRFYRVNSADEKTFPGLGLGLYISSEIVRRHGGTIQATSQEGAARVFRCVIPFGTVESVGSGTESAR